MQTIHHIKKQFPIFENRPDLVYLDSAATALKPELVLQSMDEYYRNYSANISRGLYPLAECATTAFEAAREKVLRFIHAESPAQVIFTANATHAINLVALGLEEIFSPGMNIVVTSLEHHSNYLPWKELAKRTKATLRVAPFHKDGFLEPQELLKHLDNQTRIVAFSAVSNVFGVQSPVEEIIKILRAKYPEVLILVDACQAVGHIEVDLLKWDADYVVFSGHKLFGPTGIGVLTGKEASLKLLSPKNVGGGTVLDACSTETRYKKLPENLEGGTPNIAGAIGLGTAIEFIESLGIDALHQHEVNLTKLLIEALTNTFGDTIRILGTTESSKRVGIVSFILKGIHPHDLAHLLGEQDISVRAGEHCASPLHLAMELGASTRVSLSLYNDEQDIEKLISAIKKALILFH